jgi:hypothetical protein
MVSSFGLRSTGVVVARLRMVLGAVVAPLLMVAGFLALVPTARAAVGDGWGTTKIDLLVQSAVDEPSRGALLATVAAADLGLGNELVELDPVTGALRRHVWVGSDPTDFAVTDDGDTAYVYLSGAARIARVDLTTFAVVQTFPITQWEVGHPISTRIADLAVLPGRPDVVVVSLGSDGVVAYRDGVVLPKRTDTFVNDGILLPLDAATLVGIDTGSSGGGLSLFTVDADGVTETEDLDHAMRPFPSQVELAGVPGGLPLPGLTDVLLTDDGEARNPRTGALVATYDADGDDPVGATDYDGGVFAAHDLGLVTYLEDALRQWVPAPWMAPPVLRTYSVLTGLPVGERAVPELQGVQVADLVASGPGFAVTTDRVWNAHEARQEGQQLWLTGPGVTTDHLVKPPLPAPTIDQLTVRRHVAEGVEDVAPDVAGGSLYVATSTRRSGRANRLLALDPATGAIRRTWELGASSPGLLELSDDGSTLYVVLDDRYVVRLRATDFSLLGILDLTSLGLDGSWVRSEYLEHQVYRLSIRPGHPDTVVAIVLGQWNNADSIVSWVGDRPVRTANSRYFTADWLDGDTLVTADGDAFVALALGEDGIVRTVPGGYRRFAPSGPLGGFDLRDGVLYGEAGAGSGTDTVGATDLRPFAADPTTGTPVNLGSYEVGLGYGSEAVPGLDRLYAIGGYDDAYRDSTLRELDLGTMRPITERPIDGLGRVRSLDRTDRGLAAVTTGTLQAASELVLLTFPPPPTITQVITASGAAAGPTEGGNDVVVRGRNLGAVGEVRFGDVPATGVTVHDDGELVAVAPAGAVGPVTVHASNLGGTSATTAAATYTYRPAVPITAVTPVRLLDTRPSSLVGPASGGPTTGRVLRVPVPADASPASSAAVLTVTATQPAGPGWLTVWPCGSPMPTASNVNVTDAGQTVANLVISRLGTDHDVCVYTSMPTHVVVDLTGLLPEWGPYTSLAPSRLLDTRTRLAAPAAGSVTRVRVAGRAGVPAGGAVAAVLNVTATGSTGSGYVTAWSCDATRPLASSLNVNGPGATVANLVAGALGASGEVCLYASTAMHLVVDVSGWWAADGFSAAGPERLLDTRPEHRLAWAGERPGAGQVVTLDVAGRAGVPADAHAVVLNVTATSAPAAGFVTVWPCGEPRPWASTLNIDRPGQTVAAAAVSGLGAGGRVCAYTERGTHLVVDVAGWIP